MFFSGLLLFRVLLNLIYDFIFSLYNRDNKESKFQVNVIKEEPVKMGFPFFSFFIPRRSSNDRPKSALPYLQNFIPTSNNTSNLHRKSSIDSKSRTIMDLMEKNSSNSIFDKDNSVIYEEAIAGLNAEERVHITQVLSNYNLSQPSSTPQHSRRYDILVLSNYPSPFFFTIKTFSFDIFLIKYFIFLTSDTCISRLIFLSFVLIHIFYCIKCRNKIFLLKKS